MNEPTRVFRVDPAEQRSALPHPNGFGRLRLAQLMLQHSGSSWRQFECLLILAVNRLQVFPFIFRKELVVIQLPMARKAVGPMKH